VHHLDTNIIIAYLNGNREVAEQIKTHLPNVVISELCFGARISARAKVEINA
jgi:predicted nucleic acid-binding protein